MTQLSSDLDLQATDAPAFVPQRERLEWWEDTSKLLKERRIPQPERLRRANAWYVKHSTIGALSCSQAWPPIDLDLPVEWD